MAGLNPKQVAGKHLPMFESYYLSQDPVGKGIISAMDAAKFLKRSGLSDVILGKIWDLSDPTGKGHLDKLGLFVSLKLVALAQNGKEVSVSHILDDSVPEPEMSTGGPTARKLDLQQPPPHPPQPVPKALPKTQYDWTIKEVEMNKYRQLYMSIGPDAGKIPGGKAKTLLMDSKLPLDVLGKVWDLADADKDGSLSEAEFIIAMHLVYKCLEKYPVPDSLPTELKSVLMSASITVNVNQPHQQPIPIVPIIPVVPALVKVVVDNWIVPQEDRIKYKALFQATDLDRDGFVSGMEIKDVFLQSGLAQTTLAHIWNLCDTDQSGKLSSDQFILAMWLVSNALRGFQPPPALTNEMIPPGMTVPIAPPPEPEHQLPPEFEIIMREIRELTEEKLNLECEISVKESDKKIKSGESKSLQSELETLAATLKQLESQKTVARGKLGELEGQVTTLRFQAEEQESTLIAQELELSSKSNELKGLDQEEKDLTDGLENCGRDIERLAHQLQDTLLQISQVKTRVTSLKDLENSMNESITKYVSALESNNAYVITEPELRDVKPELDEIIGETPDKYLNGEAGSHLNGFEAAFTEQQPFPVTTNHTSWNNEFGAPSRPDPFAASDPFAPHVGRGHDPFAPPPSAMRQDVSPGKDPFGAEPFAAAAPALPPKKAPPRPAPPKNAPARPPPPAFKPAALPKPADPFSQGDFTPNFDTAFADFANFDSQPWSRSQSHSQPQPQTEPPQQPRLDFTEDPFKNYRYEDPFANSDLFAE